MGKQVPHARLIATKFENPCFNSLKAVTRSCDQIGFSDFDQIFLFLLKWKRRRLQEVNIRSLNYLLHRPVFCPSAVKNTEGCGHLIFLFFLIGSSGIFRKPQENSGSNQHWLVVGNSIDSEEISISSISAGSEKQ